MSVETAINSLISTLKSMSSGYRGLASDLVVQADNDLQDMETPDVHPVKFEVRRNKVPAVRIPRPPTLPGLEELELPEPGELQAIDRLEDTFDGVSPTLISLNTFSLDIPNALDFRGSLPHPQQLSVFPKFPTLTSVDAPSLTRPTPVTEDPLSGDPPEIPVPAFIAFEGSVFAEYENGLQVVAPSLTAWKAWLTAFETPFTAVSSAFITRLQQAITGKETGLSELWETGQYTQAQQTINAERYTALQALDDAPSSVTGLPGGDRVYQNLWVELKSLEATTQAAAKVAGARHEQEAKHLQWALTTAAGLIDLLMGLKGQEALWRMTGATLALEGANATMDTLEQVLAFKEKELSFWTRYNDTQLRRVDAQIKIELSHLDVLRLDIANNQLIAAHNENQMRVYQVASGFLETRIKLYEAQFAYLAVDIDDRKLELQTYEAEIRGYQANLKAHSASIAALKANIKRDTVLAEAELLKVEQYESELAVWEAIQQAAVSRQQALLAQNKTALAQYGATLNAQLQQLRMTDQFTRSSVAALVKNFDAEAAEQQLALIGQQTENQRALFDAINTLKYEQVDLWRDLQNHQVWLQQRLSQSQVINSSAATLGSIATQAYGGLNSVGATEIVEGA